MNRLMQKGYIILLLSMWIPLSATGSANCEPCEEPNDPTLVAGGAPPCIPLDEGSAVEGEPCKECDGDGAIRNKEDGAEVAVAGVAGRCCGGVWYALDQSKEESECWEWDESTCEYVCSDVPGPEIATEEVETVELECPWSTESLPTISATAVDYCGNSVEVVQTPSGGGGAYNDGESATITLTATDECGRSSSVEVVVGFGYQCPEYEAYQTAVVNLIRAYWAAEEKCEEADLFLRDLRQAFDELRATPEVVAIGLQELCNNYTGDPGGGSLVVQIGIEYVLNQLFPRIQELVDEMQEVCNEWNDTYSALQDAYQEYLEAFGPECISRCFTPGPPLNMNCRPCDLLDASGDNPCEFRPLGNFGQ